MACTPVPTLFGLSGKLEDLRVFSKSYLSDLRNHDKADALYDELTFDFSYDTWETCTEIEPGIFLGGIPRQVPDDSWGQPNMDEQAAPHVTILKNSIRSVVSFSDHENMWWNYASYPLSICPREHRIFKMHDSVDTRLWPYFDEVSDQILRARSSQHNVFVHCHMGISRSATVLAAYYLREGLPENATPTTKEVLDFLRARRSYVRPNRNFILQLQMYEAFLRKQRNSQGELH